MNWQAYKRMERRHERLYHQFRNGGLNKEDKTEMDTLWLKIQDAFNKFFPFDLRKK